MEISGGAFTGFSLRPGAGCKSIEHVNRLMSFVRPELSSCRTRRFALFSSDAWGGDCESRSWISNRHHSGARHHPQKTKPRHDGREGQRGRGERDRGMRRKGGEEAARKNKPLPFHSRKCAEVADPTSQPAEKKDGGMPLKCCKGHDSHGVQVALVALCSLILVAVQCRPSQA